MTINELITLLNTEISKIKEIDKISNELENAKQLHKFNRNIKDNILPLFDSVEIDNESIMSLKNAFIQLINQYTFSSNKNRMITIDKNVEISSKEFWGDEFSDITKKLK